MKCSESKYSKCLYFASNALARKVEKLAIECWKPVSLSPSHGYLLILIIEEPGLQPSVVSNHLQLTPSTVTRLLEKLEEKKLVVRTSEGKQTNIYPTPKAKTMLPQLKNCVQTFYKTYSSVLGKEEISSLTTALHGASDKLE